MVLRKSSFRNWKEKLQMDTKQVDLRVWRPTEGRQLSPVRPGTRHRAPSSGRTGKQSWVFASLLKADIGLQGTLRLVFN